MEYPCIGRGSQSNALYLLIGNNRGIKLEDCSRAKAGHFGNMFKEHKISVKDFLASESLTSEIFRNLLKYWKEMS